MTLSIAGIAYVELYRQYLATDPKRADQYATKAESLLLKIPNLTGKKMFMAKSLPLDLFVERKVKKWEAHSKEYNLRFIESVGISPAEEMIYLWSKSSKHSQTN